MKAYFRLSATAVLVWIFKPKINEILIDGQFTLKICEKINCLPKILQFSISRDWLLSAKEVVSKVKINNRDILYNFVTEAAMADA